MIDKSLGFLPNLLAAGVILVVGWFVARVVRLIVTNLLAATGADNLSEKTGLAGVLGKLQLSGFLGLLAYVLIFIPVIVAALNALKIEAITQPTSSMLGVILKALPSIFAAFLVVTIAYLVGRLVARLVADLLAGVGFNNVMARLGLGKISAEGEEQRKWVPSEIVGVVVLVAIIPSLLYYTALFAQVDAHAARTKMKPLAVTAPKIWTTLLDNLHIVLGMLILIYLLLVMRFQRSPSQISDSTIYLDMQTMIEVHERMGVVNDR